MTEPFYRGFPKSVRAITSEQRFFDQIAHYMHTYRMGFLSERGHSILEDYIQRNAFDEDCEIRCFSVMTEAAAAAQLAEYVEDLLAGTRPVNNDQYASISESMIIR